MYYLSSIFMSFLLFRFILHAKKTAFVVEHDFIMATYLADRVIVFDGVPSINTVANRCSSLLHPPYYHNYASLVPHPCCLV